MFTIPAAARSSEETNFRPLRMKSQPGQVRFLVYFFLFLENLCVRIMRTFASYVSSELHIAPMVSRLRFILLQSNVTVSLSIYKDICSGKNVIPLMPF